MRVSYFYVFLCTMYALSVPLVLLLISSYHYTIILRLYNRHNKVKHTTKVIAVMRVSPCTQPKHLKCAALRGIVSSRVIAQPGHCNRYGKNITTRTSPAAAASTTATTTTTPSNVFTQEDMDAFVTGYTSIFTENTLVRRVVWCCNRVAVILIPPPFHAQPITPELVSGTIPAELSGTYVRNIPGLLEIGGVKIPQPFDGDGMVAAVTFHEGRALFRNKYVRTEALIKEQAAGRMLYQGVFNKVGSEDTLFNNPFTLV